MRFAVLGAGAIGAYLGARLVAGGAEVVLIARGEHLEAMRRDGLRVRSGAEGAGEETVVALEATGELEAVRGADAVLVALKAHSLPAIAPQLGGLLAEGVPTIWAQNGIPWWYFHGHGGELEGRALESVDPGGAVARAIGPASAVGSVVYVAAELEAPGVVRHVEGTRITLGEPDGRASERCEAIAAALRAGGLRAPVSRDLRSEIWLKLLGNATFNPISALTGATLGELGELESMRRLLLDCFGEIAAVAQALGVRLALSPQRRLEAGIAVGDHKTSMLQDLEAGRPLEYRCMTGAIIELAALVGVEVPRVQALDACVAMLETRGRSGRSGGSGRPS